MGAKGHWKQRPQGLWATGAKTRGLWKLRAMVAKDRGFSRQWGLRAMRARGLEAEGAMGHKGAQGRKSNKVLKC